MSQITKGSSIKWPLHFAYRVEVLGHKRKVLQLLRDCGGRHKYAGLSLTAYPEPTDKVTASLVEKGR
jgi:hypothetical protein